MSVILLFYLINPDSQDRNAFIDQALMPYRQDWLHAFSLTTI